MHQLEFKSFSGTWSLCPFVLAVNSRARKLRHYSWSFIYDGLCWFLSTLHLFSVSCWFFLNMPAKLRKPLLIHQDMRSISFLVTHNENPFFWRNEHVSIWRRDSFNSVQGHRVIVSTLLTKSGRQNWHPGVDQCGQAYTQSLNNVRSLVLINLIHAINIVTPPMTRRHNFSFLHVVQFSCV